MATNRVQRRLRDISNEHCDDTAIEMDCVEAARRALDVGCPVDAIKTALIEGVEEVVTC